MSTATISPQACNTNVVMPNPLDWQEIRRRLQNKQAEIINEIRAYPAPIPACDAQYNYLLEQRTVIRQELRRAEALQQQWEADTVSQRDIAEFVQASQFLEEHII